MEINGGMKSNMSYDCGQKNILAHILVKTVQEFKGMNPKDVVAYIEGLPYISRVPVEPGLTNISSEKDGQRIIVLVSIPKMES